MDSRRLISVGGRALGWLIVAGLAVVALVRVWQPGTSTIVVGLVAVSSWMFFLAWPVVVVAGARRQWLMAAAALVLVVVQVIVVLPIWKPWASASAPVGSWRLRVLDANVLFQNPDLSELGSEIKAFRPDVVMLEEVTPPNLQSLEDTGAVAGFQYSFLRPRIDSTGFAVWSDQPLVNSQLWYAYGHPEYAGELHPAGHAAISLLEIHTVAPYGDGEPHYWKREMDAIQARVAATPHPALVVGDFNAENEMKQFRSILHLGFTDAAVAQGKGWQMTWPRNRTLIPALVRPDHVLYSSNLTSTSYQLGTDQGSDHRPLKVVLAASG